MSSAIVVVILLLIFGTGWLQYNVRLHFVFLFIYLGVMTLGAGYGNEDLLYALPLLMATHYTSHWVLKQGAKYGKKIPYPTTHRDLRDIHSPFAKPPGE